MAMPAVPLSLALPAAATSFAYLNAKLLLSYDYRLISSLARATIRCALRDRNGRWNLFYLLEEHALKPSTANRPFLVFQNKVWTFYEAYQSVLRYGNWLKQTYDIKPKEVVALDFMNSSSFIFMWMGLWSIGATPALLNYNLVGAPLVHCVKVSTSRFLFVDEDVKGSISPDVLEKLAAPDFREGGGSVEVVFHNQELESKIFQSEPFRAPDADRGDRLRTDPALLIYTSGTTGLPKAAIVSWNKFLLAGSFSSLWMGLQQTDRMYTCMPLYHATAAILGYGACLVNGTSIAVGRRFSSSKFWDEVRESESTIIQYVGETLRYLLSNPPQRDPNTGEDLDKQHNVRMAYGNGLRPDIWNKVKDRFGIQTVAELYSATESTSGFWNLSNNDFSVGAIGRNGALATTVLGRSIAVVELDYVNEIPWRDPETGFCKKLPQGDLGELLYAVDANDIKAKFQGYFNNEGATNSKIMRDVFSKGDAWFRTGDVVKWDTEGRWYFSDRIGDTFRWRGENVSTNEVAEILGNHPEVDEANVYGVELPHHDGRSGCAALVLRGRNAEGESSADSDLLPEAPPAILKSLAQHTTSNLPKYAVPLFLRVTRVMQTTGNNKHQKHSLRTEGVDPNALESKDSKDILLWLRGGTYVPFGKKEWDQLSAGGVKL